MANLVDEEVSMLQGGENVDMDLQNVTSESTKSSFFPDFYRAHRYAPGEAVKTRA